MMSSFSINIIFVSENRIGKFLGKLQGFSSLPKTERVYLKKHTKLAFNTCLKVPAPTL